jgi:hypothetical protein
MENYERDGTVKGDQGQLAKRRKSMLKMLHGKIAMLPMAVVFTDHVYPQDIMMGDGAWAMTNSVKFFPSITALVTKLKLKEGTDVVGIRMRVETYKSRFAQVGRKIELEIPYSTGLSPFSGFIELGESLGIFAKGTQPGEKTSYVCDVVDQSTGEILDHIVFKEKDLTHELVARVLKHHKAVPVTEIKEETTEELMAIMGDDSED